jgi:hypothetical protein
MKVLGYRLRRNHNSVSTEVNLLGKWVVLKPPPNPKEVAYGSSNGREHRVRIELVDTDVRIGGRGW